MEVAGNFGQKRTIVDRSGQVGCNWLQFATRPDHSGQLTTKKRAICEMRRGLLPVFCGYWNIKRGGCASRDLADKSQRSEFFTLWRFFHSSLFTLAHSQFALTNSLLQYVLTCTLGPAEEMLPAARARARLRYNKILRLAAQEVATRNKATLEDVLSHGEQH